MRLIPLVSALLLAALVAIPTSGIAHAQEPFGDNIVLVNYDRDFVERKKKGEFVARPVFDREIERPLLRRPGRRHRRLDKRHVPGPRRREEAQRRLGILLGVPGARMSSPTSTPTGPTSWS